VAAADSADIRLSGAQIASCSHMVASTAPLNHPYRDTLGDLTRTSFPLSKYVYPFPSAGNPKKGDSLLRRAAFPCSAQGEKPAKPARRSRSNLVTFELQGAHNAPKRQVVAAARRKPNKIV